MNNINIEGKLVAVYVRTNSSKQEDKNSTDEQLLVLHKYAEENGYKIVREYIDEGVSGNRLERPALDELRIEARKGLWDSVLVCDIDRLSRNFVHCEVIISELSDCDKNIIFINSLPPVNLDDKMMRSMRGIFAEYENKKRLEGFRLSKINNN